MWEELHKAWENGAGNLWVVNVGDIKPAEIGISYYAALAWSPQNLGPDSQPIFLKDFAAKTFGENSAQPIADLLMDFYRLGTIRKPELMNRAWALSLPNYEVMKLEHDYMALLTLEKNLAASISPAQRDAYTETIGFPAQVLAETGLIFMADRQIQYGNGPEPFQSAINVLRTDLESQVENYNTQLAGGKWHFMMPGLETNKDLTKWSSQVRWPWGEPPTPSHPSPPPRSLPCAMPPTRFLFLVPRKSAGKSSKAWANPAAQSHLNHQISKPLSPAPTPLLRHWCVVSKSQMNPTCKPRSPSSPLSASTPEQSSASR